MSNYDATSPYFTTGYSQFFLDVMVNRAFPQESDDLKFKLNLTYQYRPDLLAHDLYGDARLWWVFAQRNPNRLKDPVFDFVPGLSIYVPKMPAIQKALGL